jgi:hypothetical protein
MKSSLLLQKSKKQIISTLGLAQKEHKKSFRAIGPGLP